MSETEFVQEWSPWKGKKVREAWLVVIQKLAEKQPQDFADLIPAMSEAAGIEMKTAGNILREGVRAGALKKSGGYSPRTKRGRLVWWRDNVDPKWTTPPEDLEDDE